MSLFYQGHVYEDAGEVPCPMEDCEDGLVVTHTEEGTPAYWSDGHLFVKDEDQSVETPVNDWVGKVPRMKCEHCKKRDAIWKTKVEKLLCTVCLLMLGYSPKDVDHV